MILEAVSISVAAIIIAALMTANMIHKRMLLAEDPNAEARRILERARVLALQQEDNVANTLLDRSAWVRERMRLEDELLKLTKRAAEDPTTEARRVLERARRLEELIRDNSLNSVQQRQDAMHAVRDLDEKLLKLARGEDVIQTVHDLDERLLNHTVTAEDT